MAEAGELAEKAVAICESLVKSYPKALNPPTLLAEALLRRGQARGDRGTPADCRRGAEVLGAQPAGDEPSFLAACCHAMLAGSEGLEGTSREDERRAEAEKAMALLRRAVALGHRDYDAYRTETALDPLRSRADFRSLMADLAFPAEPFAR